MNEIIAPAVVPNLPPELYHSHGYSSNSSLKPLPDDPETYFARNIADPKPAWARRPRAVTRPMQLGTAFHSIMLEGVIPPVVPDCLLASNGAMTTKMAKAFAFEHPDYVRQAEYDDLMYAHDRCLEDPKIRPFLETEHQNELSLFWKDEPTGEFCRGRIDRLCHFSDGLWILDLKFGSADPNDEAAIGYKIFDMGYDCQSAMYTDGVEYLIGHVNGFVFLFCRNTPPYDCAIWQISDNDLEMGRRHYREKLQDLRERRLENRWHNPRFGRTSMTLLPRKAWDRSVAAVAPIQSPFTEFDDFKGET
jgi:hypothetical protein